MRSPIFAEAVSSLLESRNAWLQERGLLRPVNARTQPIAAQTSDGDGELAEMWLMEEIGFWGMDARTFSEQMRTSVKADQRLLVHLNSRGGDVFDGIAIYNALAAHPSEVTVRVEGQAASIASVVAQAGDRVLMAPHSYLYIHDAWGMTIGNEADHLKTAGQLKELSDEVASIYAERSKTGARTWRQRMRDESQYNAERAVELGLADAVDKTDKTGKAAALRDAAIRAKRDPEEVLREAGFSRRVAKALVSDVEDVNNYLEEKLARREPSDALRDAERDKRQAEVAELRRVSLTRS